MRAKLKAMLDKNIASAAAKESRDQATPTAMPTPEQLESIESDSFTAQSFQSQRTPGKQVEFINIILSYSFTRFTSLLIIMQDYTESVHVIVESRMCLLY